MLKARMRSAYGFWNRTRTVAGSGVSIPTRPSKPPLQLAALTFGSRTRSIVNRTSSDETRDPSSHVAAGSRWNS